MHHGFAVVFHVVAQVIKPVFVIGAVGNVAVVSGAALFVVQPVDDDAHREAEKLVHATHPRGIAFGEIVVHRNNMHALARQRVEIRGQRGHQRFAFAGFHFGDHAAMQHHAADQLHIEMAHTQYALGGFTHNGKCLDQQTIQRCTGGELGAEFVGLCAQIRIT